MEIVVSIRNGNIVARGAVETGEVSGICAQTELAMLRVVENYNRKIPESGRNLQRLRATCWEDMVEWAHTNHAKVSLSYDFDA